MRRRDFLSGLTRISAAALALPLIASCVAEPEEERPLRPGAVPGGGSAPPGPDGAFAINNDDDSGHLHAFEMHCTEEGKDGFVYTATGPHEHQVEVSAQQLEEVFAGGTVTIQTTDKHPHTWRLRMPGTAC